MIEIGHLEQGELQDGHISTNRKKDGERERYRNLLILLKYFEVTAAIIATWENDFVVDLLAKERNLEVSHVIKLF